MEEELRSTAPDLWTELSKGYPDFGEEYITLRLEETSHRIDSEKRPLLFRVRSGDKDEVVEVEGSSGSRSGSSRETGADRIEDEAHVQTKAAS